MNYEKISLDERLKRIEAGFASSPQFSFKIVDDFSATPIIPALESIGAFAERQMLSALMADKELDNAYTCSENPTFGDIASIITVHYLRYGVKPPDRVGSLTNSVGRLISIYFKCFNRIINFLHRRGTISSNDINSYMKSLYNFLNIPFEDYYSYMKKTCTNFKQCDCKKVIDKIDIYSRNNGFSSNMSPLMIYDELIEYADDCEDFIFGIYGDEIPKIKECESLIEFFILPISLIATIKKINQKGANKNEK